MADIGIKRIKKEFKELLKSEEVSSGSLKVELIGDTWTSIRAEISGPPDTPYETGRFKLQIRIPPRYPFLPPEVQFTTKIWHPNVTVDGAICLDILAGAWAASMSLRTVLLSIQALLATPEPNDPFQFEAAQQMKRKPQIFDSTVRHWTHVYAGGACAQPQYDALLRRLVGPGVTEDQARLLLSEHNWNLKLAKKSYNRYGLFF